MTKHEFVTQYVLNRARAVNAFSLNGAVTTSEALVAWDMIKRSAPATEKANGDDTNRTPSF